VQTTIYRDSSVTVNPFRVSALSRLEHIPFLRMAERALEIEREYGIPAGAAAYIPPDVYLPRTGALALAGAGVRILLKEQEHGDPFEWWEVPGGTRVLVVSVPAGSTPGALGFDLSVNEMTARVEDWLSSTALRFAPDEDSGTAVVLSANAENAFPAALETVSSWNARFAYPRFAVGDPQVLSQTMDASSTDTSVGQPASINLPATPLGEELVLMRDGRRSHSEKRSRDLARVLGHAVAPGLAALEAVAAYVTTPVSGTLVFNSSPYEQSDLVRMSDGSERLATNVPGLGYAFFPDLSVTGEKTGWESSVAAHSAEGQRFRVTIDAGTGAISSLVQLEDGKEWVRPGSDGLNAVREARLLKVMVERMPGTATRLVVTRWAPGVGTFTSTVTVYDEQPWLSLVNETEVVANADANYVFHLALSDAEISWEVPGGHQTSAVPVSALEHLRWISVADNEATLMFRGYDAPYASVDLDATLTSIAPRGISRYRIAPLRRYASEDLPWVFGWNSESMVLARVEPNGSDTLPRYGSLFEFERVGVTILGVQPAEDGLGAVVYLQETLGVSRDVSFGPGILNFSHAETVDFLERYVEALPLGADGRLSLPLPANSVVAIRVSGLGVSEPQ
jgi:hypothetical protein